MTASVFRAARFWGQLLWRVGVFQTVRVDEKASELVREGGRKRGREEESGACEEEGGSFRQPHWTTLTHCSLSFLL